MSDVEDDALSDAGGDNQVFPEEGAFDPGQAVTTATELCSPDLASLPRIDKNFPFHTFCMILEDLATPPPSAEKNLAEYRRNVLNQRLWKQVNKGDFYPFLRLLVPSIDEERPKFSMRETFLARFYIEMLQLPKQSADAQRLIHFKTPGMSKSAKASVFSDHLFRVLEERGYAEAAAGRPRVSVSWVNDRLNELALAANNDARKLVIRRLIDHCSPLEQKWIVRIMLQDLRIGMAVKSVLKAFHPFAEQVYNQRSQLKLVCLLCRDPNFTLSTLGDSTMIQVGQPVRPMLAESILNTRDLEHALRESLCIEPKYDGERVLIHVTPTAMTYFTRNCNNYTHQYAPTMDAVVRAALRSQKASHTYECILDGEMLVFQEETQTYLPFGNNRSVANAQRDGMDIGKAHFAFKCFDILHFAKMEQGKMEDYNVLKKMNYEGRRTVLKALVAHQKPNYFELVPSTPVPGTGATQNQGSSASSSGTHSSKDQAKAFVLAALDKAVIEDGAEGIMLKQTSSLYNIDAQRGKGWFKFKPEYLADSVRFDMVVVGGYYGTKYGQTHVSHFLMALRNGDVSAEGNPASSATASAAPAAPPAAPAKPLLGMAAMKALMAGSQAAAMNNNASSSVLSSAFNPGAQRESQICLVCCKVGSGYNSEELTEIQRKLSPHWRSWADTNVDADLRRRVFGSWKPDKDDTPQVWIDPRKSIVFEVRFGEIVESRKFQLMWTLRFPRCAKVRHDKSFADATTVEQFEAARRSMADRTMLGSLDAGRGKRGGSALNKKGRKTSILWNSDEAVPSHLRKCDLGAVPVISQALQGKSFRILYPQHEDDRRKIELDIHSHGGRVTMSVADADFCLTKSTARTNLDYQTAQHIKAFAKHVYVSRHHLKITKTEEKSLFAPRDVLTLAFLSDCITEGKIIDPPNPVRHIIYARPETEEEVERVYDEFGDPFYQDITSAELMDILERYVPTKKKFEAELENSVRKDLAKFIKEPQLLKSFADEEDEIRGPAAKRPKLAAPRIHSTDAEVNQILEKLDDVSLSPFRSTVIRFVGRPDNMFLRMHMRLVEAAFAQHVGHWDPATEPSSVVPSECTHLIVDPRDVEYISAAHRLAQKRRFTSSVKVVSYDWVVATNEDGLPSLDSTFNVGMPEFVMHKYHV